MIDPSGAELALENLRQRSAEAEDALISAETATFTLKEMEAIVVEELWQQTNPKVPITLIPKLIYKDKRIIDAGKKKAQAVANLGRVNADINAFKTEISIYQSKVKDQM
jgi:hypothetical protein